MSKRFVVDRGLSITEDDMFSSGFNYLPDMPNGIALCPLPSSGIAKPLVLVLFGRNSPEVSVRVN